MQLPIADLHCDLLCYLSRNAEHTPYDLPVRCAIPQLKKGNVKVQTLAIFTETQPGSSKNGLAQADVFKGLPTRFPDVFEFIRSGEQFGHLENSLKIGILPAIENASSFCEENDHIDEVLSNLTCLQRKIGKLAYVSLTWNSENRFGGGAATNVGLKSDGKRLINYLVSKKIPLDFSHTSDRLAYDIINYLEKENLYLPLLASHSNLRSVTNLPRNLPDDITKEIIRRKGLIGLNFFRAFVGVDSSDYFIRHLERILEFNGEKSFCFGADFFHDDDLSPQYRMKGDPFFPSFDNSSAYPHLIDLWRKRHSTTYEVLKLISYHNVVNFLRLNLFETSFLS